MMNSKATISIVSVSCKVIINSVSMSINFLVVIVFLRFHKKLLLVNNNKFLFSMAVSDLMVGIFGIIESTLTYLYQHDLVTQKMVKLCGYIPLFGSFSCQYYH